MPRSRFVEESRRGAPVTDPALVPSLVLPAAPQLRAALQQADGAVPGFMLVADCVLHRDASPSARARFGGMVMGELQGWEVYKRIDVPEFHNIHYVREMLFQVGGRAWLGASANCRLPGRNIALLCCALCCCSHSTSARLPATPAGVLGAGPCSAQARLPPRRPGHAQHHGALPAVRRPSARLARTHALPLPACQYCVVFLLACMARLPRNERASSLRPLCRCRTWEQVPGWARARAEVPVRPGYTCNADGSRLPLGPDIEVGPGGPAAARCRCRSTCQLRQQRHPPQATRLCFPAQPAGGCASSLLPALGADLALLLTWRCC